MLTGLGNSEACFFSKIKAVFMENKGYNDLWRHLALQRQWRCHHRRHREEVHEAGRGRRQYDVQMAEQWGVSSLVRAGCVCDPLLD
jgi:hypothetical protein